MHGAWIWIAFLLHGIYIFGNLPTVQGSTYFNIGSENVTVEHQLLPIPNAYNQCYVNVYVYNSTSFTDGLENATVTVLSNKKENGTLYEFYATGLTNSKGQTCVLTKCQTECDIFVENNGVRVLAIDKARQQSRLPNRFKVNVQKGNEIVNFYSFVWGTFNGRSGPVFNSDEKAMCQAGNSIDYKFTFSYISVPDQLVSTPTPLNTTDITDYLAWMYGLPSDRHVCYLKIKIKTRSTQVTFTATSLINNVNGGILGEYIAGPKYDLALSDITTKAVCLQFRCPVRDIISGIPVKTFVTGNVSIPGRKDGCCVRDQKLKDIAVSPTNFSVTFVVSENYGPSQGVYKSALESNARSRCYTGHDFLGTEYSMDVTTGAAFEYDCTDTCLLNGPLVG